MIKIGTVNGDVIEAGGVKNVTNNYYSEQETKPSEDLKVETEVPAELAESNLWKKVQEAGLVDADGQPTVSRTEAAILADILLEKMGKEHEWTLFEKMWNRKNMRNDWQAALELKKYDEVHERMKKKLC